MSLPIHLVMDRPEPIKLNLLVGGDGLKIRSLGQVVGHFFDALEALFDAPEGVDEEQDRKKRNRESGDLSGVHKPSVSPAIPYKVKEPDVATQ